MSLSANKEQFYHQLSTLLEAGLSVRDATQHLQTQRNQHLPGIANALADGTARGLPLSEALKAAPAAEVDALEISLLRAAERGGKLELATRQLEQHFSLQAQVWKQLKQGMLYPLLVLHAAIILPSITVLLGQGSVLKDIVQPLLLAYFIIALIWVGARWLWRAGGSSTAVDAFLNTLPLLGSWRKSLTLARFCQALGVQLQTGENVANAVTSAAEAANSASIKLSGLNMGRKIHQEGCALGPLLLASPQIRPTLAQVLSTAETVGRLDEEALLRAKSLMNEASNSASLSGTWLPKLLYAPIAAYALYRVYTFYTGYIDSISAFT